MKPKKKESGQERRAIQLDKWIHPIMLSASRNAGLGVGEAYTEAVLAWIRKAYQEHEKVKMVLDVDAKDNPDLRAVLGPTIVAPKKRASG